VGSLTRFQKSVVVGTVLGDGYLRRIKGRADVFLEINHSFQQKEYVDWKYGVLGTVVVGKPRKRFGNGGRIAYRFYTKQLPELTDLHQDFYTSGRKVVPNITLDPVILAVWFMDDGSKCRASDVYLNTQQFDLESQAVLLRMLEGLGLQARLNRDKEYFRIRFLKSSLKRLQFLISDYIIPSMKYKIEL